MSIDFSSLLNTNPPYQFKAFWPLLIFFALAVVAALLVSFYPFRPWQRNIQRVAPSLWVLGLGGVLLLIFRNQSIQYLSTPIILLLLLLVSLLFFGYNLRVALREIRKSKSAHLEAQRLERYLPKPKRKS